MPDQVRSGSARTRDRNGNQDAELPYRRKASIGNCPAAGSDGAASVRRCRTDQRGWIGAPAAAGIGGPNWRVKPAVVRGPARDATCPEL